jgi:hypothetical protein
MANSTPRIACTTFHPLVDTVIWTNSLPAAKSATTPNRIEIAYTVV